MSSAAKPILLRGAAIVLAWATVAPICVPMVSGATRSEEAIACGGTNNPIEAEFDLATSADLWRVFPALGISPETEEARGPIHVVVFEGEFDMHGRIADPLAAETASNAVCVTLGDGTYFVYVEVSRSGMRLP